MEATNPVNDAALLTSELVPSPGASESSSEAVHTPSSPPPPSVVEPPTQLTTECGICFQNIPLMHTGNSACCGGVECFPCYKKCFFKEPGVRGTCPWCREPHVMEDEVIPKLTHHALRGNKAWAFYSLAQYCMGRDGKMHVDTAKGIEYYTRALELGDLRALHYLGCHYGSGHGVAESVSKSMDYFMQGYSAGIEVCTLDLATVYSTEDVKMEFRDDTKAVHYMTLACQQGSLEACLTLGQWYVKGQFGLTVDEAKGIELVKKATDSGLQQAQFFLASHYFKNDQFRYTPLCIKYCEMALRELQDTDDHYIVNAMKPLSPKNRDLLRFMVASRYTSGGIARSAFSVFDGYLWFKTYLKKHDSSCIECVDAADGCEGIIRANRNVADVHRVMSTICACCGTKSQQQLKVCTGCRVARFCNTECHRAGWDAHKKTCKAIREVIE